MNKEKPFVNSIFYSKPLEGTISGKQFDVRKISRIGKQNIWIHGELKQTNEKNTKVEVSSYPPILVGLPLAVLLFAVSIGIINLLLITQFY